MKYLFQLTAFCSIDIDLHSGMFTAHNLLFLQTIISKTQCKTFDLLIIFMVKLLETINTFCSMIDDIIENFQFIAFSTLQVAVIPSVVYSGTLMCCYHDYHL